MPTVTVDTADLDLAAGPVASSATNRTINSAALFFEVPAVAAYGNPAGGEGGGIMLLVVDQWGEPYGPLAGVSLESFSEDLADVGGGVLRFFTNDPDHGAQTLRNLPDILSREVQVWRNGRLFAWLVPVRIEVDDVNATLQCATPEWYFTRRFFGKADRTNYVVDGGFEAVPPDPLVGAWSAFGVTFDRSTERRVTGARSAKLIQANAQTDTYVYQVIDDFESTGVGTLLTLNARFWIDPDEWIGEAFDKRGLVIVRYDEFGNEVDDGAAPVGIFEIDGLTARGSWQEAETEVWMPPSQVNDLELRCMAVGGVIFWDHVTLTIMESLSSVEGPDDFEMEQALIFSRYVDHAQNPLYRKDDRNIRVLWTPTGVQRERHQQFAEHQNVWVAMREFPQLEDGFDFRMEYPDPSTRQLVTGNPRVGSYKPQYALEDGKNVVGVRLSLDGAQAANNVTILSIDSDGPDRAEGSAVDDSFYGVDLEHVEAAPAGTPIDALDEMAAERLSELRRPVILEVTVNEDVDGLPIAEQEAARRIFDNLRVGDRVPVRIDRGWIQVSDTYKVVRRVYDAKNDLMTYTLNRSP